MKSILTNTKIIVGMSGGVDSSVAALLLIQQGYKVEGLFMKNWENDDEDGYCTTIQDAQDAQAVCNKLNIPLHIVNFSQQYWDRVFDYFLAEYREGRTPNPDILCNKEIKFKVFLNYAREQLGTKYIATGHHVRRSFDKTSMQLLTGLDSNKDQSYFLYALNQAQLSAALFPIGELKKPQVRYIAQKARLHNADKKDSTGICFIGERKFKHFLREYLPAKPGNIETPAGITIGQHDGLMYYTIGQRKGLGIGGLHQMSGEAWYVAAKDLDRNVLIVVQGQNHPSLFSQQLYCEQWHWIAGKAPNFTQTYTAKTRYRQKAQPCHILLKEEKLLVQFKQAQRAITPGQSIVFYDNEICLGGGIIIQAIK